MSDCYFNTAIVEKVSTNFVSPFSIKQLGCYFYVQDLEFICRNRLQECYLNHHVIVEAWGLSVYAALASVTFL